MTQVVLFLRIYLRPWRAFGPVIDEARLIFAVGVAILAVFVVQAPRDAEYQAMISRVREYVKAHPAPPAESANRANRANAPSSQGDDANDDDSNDAESTGLAGIGGMPFLWAASEFTGVAPFHYLPPLLSMAICFVPAALLIVSLWQGMGRFSNVLFRDYLTLLVCALMAWAAAYLPVGIANIALKFVHPAWHNSPWLWWAGSAGFLVLTVFALRTLMGATILQGAGAVAGAWVAGVGGVWLYSLAGGVTWYFASPCVLYYLWANLQGSFYNISYGLSARQRMKRNLENLTINPKDADAHCQLGQVYLHRRQYELAAERFQKAVEIDPSDAEGWYQLGRIARLQGRYSEALVHCQTGLRLDDKHSGSEVWRELGVVQHLSGRHEAARYALEQFIQRREYDPEGQCWYGRVLAALGENEKARAAFQNAVEAARTMPAPRKYQVRIWGTEAGKELRALRGASGKAPQGDQQRWAT